VSRDQGDDRAARARRSGAGGRGVFIAAGAGLVAAHASIAVSSGAHAAYRFAPGTVAALVLLRVAWRSGRAPSLRYRVRRLIDRAATGVPTWLGWVLLIGGLTPLAAAASLWIVPGFVGLATGHPHALLILSYAGFAAPVWAALLAMTVVGARVVRTSKGTAL